MSTVKKRLHVSGLTPAITADDINARLRGFGQVHALDGFGATNAIGEWLSNLHSNVVSHFVTGEPRKFAYVTLEATEANLSRCVNVLSGTTWKGTKLRIGDAKPDYAQRLEAERKRDAETEKEPLSKRRRLPRGVQGLHAADMSTIDTKNVTSHPGWHKTSLSHLIRPMKMRPLRPLPDTSTGQKTNGPKKRRKKPSSFDVPTRARVKMIDPRLYGAVHLRGDLLEAVVIDPLPQMKLPKMPRSPSMLSNSSDTPPPSTSQIKDVLKGSVSVMKTKPLTALGIDEDLVLPDLEREKARDLDLLTTMFDDDTSDWGGKESINEEDAAAFPMGEIDAMSPEVDISAAPEDKPESEPEKSPTPQKKKVSSLKDMFKPREEEAGFSVLAGLGDLEFDFDFDPAFEMDIATPIVPVPTLHTTVPNETPVQQGYLTLDSSLPFFFPQPGNPRAKDLFSLARTEGWEFGRTGDSDAIRKRWDETKGALTRDWKKRARDAVKSRRRRYGAAEGEDA
ncbi:hypothetical protein K439DRAFT_1660344 [Ramaria rubella]|nr:hypothetical protein K439DRAFT_1660344 [Ramaria rubella]